ETMRLCIEVLGEIANTAKTMGLALPTMIGADIRPRLELGTIDIGFAVLGPRVLCLKRQVAEDDPIWEVLVRTGISELSHAPAVPIAVSPDDLAATRGRG